MKYDKQKIISVFEMVRDIPYGFIGSRDPLLVLKKRKGTCSGKHLLLGYLYQSMGVGVKYMMCLTKFNFIKNIMPYELKSILGKNEIYDYHNYLRIFVGEWLDVDITFDLPLKKYGFVINDNWDCTSKPIEIYCVSNLVGEKEKALSAFSKDERESRDCFIKQMSIWAESIRTES